MNRVHLTISQSSQPGRLEMPEGKFLIYLFRKWVLSVSFPSGPLLLLIIPCGVHAKVEGKQNSSAVRKTVSTSQLTSSLLYCRHSSENTK